MKTVHINASFNTAINFVKDMGKTPWVIVDGTLAVARPFDSRDAARNSKLFLKLTGTVVKAADCEFVVTSPVTEAKETKRVVFMRLIHNATGASRKEVIDRAVAEMGISKACASTYFTNSNKAWA